MDATTKTRRITILCDADRHNYCLQGCECTCHYDLKIDRKLSVLGYELWSIGAAFELPGESAETRRGRLRGVIRSAENSVDFRGYSVDEVTDRMEKVLSRADWSIWEFNEDFDLNYDGTRKVS